MQKYGACMSVSLHILHWKNASPWAQMECTEETKVWSAQLVSILVSYGSETNLIYGLNFFAPTEQVSMSIDGIIMAVKRRGFNWKGHAQGVRGDTLKSISLCFRSIHIHCSLFQLTGSDNLQHATYAGGKIGSPFPIIMLNELILCTLENKWMLSSTYCSTILNGNLHLHLFCCF